MRFLFVSAQLPGHLDWGGYLPTARALHARGHAVLWVSGAEVQAAVAHQGLPFQPVATTGWRWPPPPPLKPAPDTPRAEVMRAMQVRSLDQWLDVDRVVAAVDALAPVVETFRPDVIVGEMFMAAAGIVAARAEIPFAVAGWPAPAERADAGAHPLETESRARLQAILAQVDAPAVNWTANGPAALASPHLHISYWSPRWHGVAAGGYAVHGAQTRYVGGVRPAAAATQELPPPELPAPEMEPWVLITLGTSFNRDLAFFGAAAQAADALGCLPLVVTGRTLSHAEQAWLQPRLPRSAMVMPHVDFARTLPHLAAALHHGGAGTTHALVCHGVPQAVVPHAADQQRQAQGVARTEVGFHIAPAQATVDNLSQALAQLLPDRSPYRAQARQLQHEFAALGGVPRAAALLEAVATDATA
ncbi:MAG: hypothetical protein H6644_18105 [Caldilineaceae bacterium]|nr:hypothetical protein [Caldilineaceae bacterium]